MIINDLDTNQILDIDQKNYPSRLETERETEAGGEEKKNQSDLLVDIILTEKWTFFCDQFQEPHCVLPEAPFIATKLESKKIQQLCSGLFYAKYRKGIRPDAVMAAIQTLQGKTRYEGAHNDIYNRIAQVSQDIYYDIGDDTHVIHISANGWEVKNTAPVFFRRYAHQTPQDMPQRGGNLTDCLQYLNCGENEQQKLLFLAYIPTLFFANTPRFLLLVHGAQGSGKSTFLSLLRSLVDPSQTPLLTPPQTTNELVQQLHHHYFYCLDNISDLSQSVSDTLCKAVTGDGFSKRELYTDDDDVMVQYKRAVAINSIAQIATRPDLLERSLLISLPMITPENRREEQKLLQEFSETKPLLFGAILDGVVGCLRLAPALPLRRLPRMADAYRYAAGVAVHLGHTPEQFSETFFTNTQRQNKEAIDASPIAQVLVEFMTDRADWLGSSTELFSSLIPLAETLKVAKGFPKNPNWLWRKIAPLQTNLLACGISITRSEEAKNSVITLEKREGVIVATATTAATSSSEMQSSDGNNGDIGSIKHEPITLFEELSAEEVMESLTSNDEQQQNDPSDEEVPF